MFRRFLRFSLPFILFVSSSLFAQSVETYFSPKGGAQEAIIRNVLNARQSIDVAMYNFSSPAIFNAFKTLKEKNPDMPIRMIFDDAANTQKDSPGATTKAQMSEALERIGVDVRYVSKIMHHKFAIIDGFADGLSGDEDFSQTVVLSGSGNFSNRANTAYDENLAEFKNHPAVTTDFQKEFQLIWNYSYDFPDESQQKEKVYYESQTFPFLGISPIFTSQNFKPGMKFSLNGNRVASQSLEEAIGSAKQSIYVATGHFRLKPLADALIDAKRRNPDLDVKIILDSQEFVSRSAHENQMGRYKKCIQSLSKNPTEEEKDKCELAGQMKFSRYLSENGVDVRLKYSAYIWFYEYDPQMHHKYMIIDGRDVLSGSYNWSRNAEFNTFENVVHYQNLPSVAEDYTNNFWGIWELNRARLNSHIKALQKQNRILLHFTPMTLSVPEIDEVMDVLLDEVPGFFVKAKPEHRYWDKRRNQGSPTQGSRE